MEQSDITYKSFTKLGKEERDCILIFDELEGVWYAETSIPKFWRRLEKKNWTLVSTQLYPDGTVCSKSFKGSKKGVTITDPFKVRSMSDEQKDAARQRFIDFHNSNIDDDEEEES